MYVKPNGLLGTGYMAAIRPFRHRIVYPRMLRQIGRAWQTPSEVGGCLLNVEPMLLIDIEVLAPTLIARSVHGASSSAPRMPRAVNSCAMNGVLGCSLHGASVLASPLR